MRVIGLNTEHDFFELGIVANKATVRRIVGVLRPQRKDVVKQGVDKSCRYRGQRFRVEVSLRVAAKAAEINALPNGHRSGHRLDVLRSAQRGPDRSPLPARPLARGTWRESRGRRRAWTNLITQGLPPAGRTWSVNLNFPYPACR